MNNKNKIFELNPQNLVVLLMLFILTGLWLIYEYLDKEKRRNLMVWQSQLASISEMKASSIELMLNNKKNEIYALADNASLRLYLTQYKNKSNINESIINAQKSHVKNLMLSSYLRTGVDDNNFSHNNLNLNDGSEYGLFVLDSNKKIIMASNKFKGNIDALRETVDLAYKTLKSQVIEIYKSENQRLIYGYIVPVFELQDINEKNLVGTVIVMLNPYKDVYELIARRQSVTQSDEAILVKKNGTQISYISPLKKPFNVLLSIADKENILAASYVVSNPMGFSQKQDYQGVSVLVTGRKIKGTSWYMVQKISVSEAMEESKNHQKFLLIVFGLILVSISLIFIAIWKHSTNKRLQVLSEDLETRTTLLNSITDNITENILLLDKTSKIEFINPCFSKMLSVHNEDVSGVRVENIIGKNSARELIDNGSKKQDKDSIILQINETGHEYHVTKTELKKGRYEGSNLYVLHDISSLRNEQKKREKLSDGIINTLVKAVDLHDPHCANHSQRTSEVAYEIGREMNMDSRALETLRMAALLANIGKIFVSKDILTKHEKLSENESNELKRHIEYAVNILQELSFNGPVVEIISQKNERIDGNGYPEGLSEEAILPEAKILSVANAFVAMTSSRAYREGRKVDEVVNLLVEQSGSQYDRHVVAALFHIAENKANWKSWYSVDAT